MRKVVLIPGNNDSKVSDIWFPYVKAHLENKGYNVVANNMPDPIKARKTIWLPYMEDELMIDKDTIAVGHSSGAVALLRYCETHKVKAIILIGAYHIDFGDKTEKMSGYFDDEWDWDAINNNCEFIIQFASTDDPYIPVEESRYLKSQLPKLEYIEFNDKGHMGEDINLTEFPELVEMIVKIAGFNS